MSAPAGAEVRAVAARVLAAVLDEGRSLKTTLAHALPGIADLRDRALVEAIAFQTLRHRRRYEHALSQWLQKPLGRRDAIVRNLLLAGLAQIDALRLPVHAAVGSTAEAARLLGRPGLVGLVNAVLRRAAREPWPTSDNRAIAASHPDRLVDALAADWPDAVDTILAGGNTPPPLWLRPNTTRSDRARLLQDLVDAGLAASPSTVADDAVCVPDSLPVTSLPGWDEGRLVVQDAAAQLAVQALAPRAGERVLDACAAPGGKTAQIAERIGGGKVVGVDVDARRLRHVEALLERLGLADRVSLRAADAADPAAWWNGVPFDAILLDAPCSATGIIRRQPDIKWHRRAADIAPLAELQAKLLDAAWTTLRPGGRLLYSTCSLLRDENDRQIDAFLARTPDAAAAPLDDRWGRVAGAGRQRFPGEDGMDGFFYALLHKAPA
jgi:16S rRNA (cytosine967-C5)-methyltransferase